MARPTAEQRLADALACAEVTPSGCILWPACRSANGYGIFSWGGRQIGAHRAAFMARHGPVAAGVFICHHCDNPPCVNVDHLYAGDAESNNADRYARDRYASKITREQAILMHESSAVGVTPKQMTVLFPHITDHAVRTVLWPNIELHPTWTRLRDDPETKARVMAFRAEADAANARHATRLSVAAAALAARTALTVTGTEAAQIMGMTRQGFFATWAGRIQPHHCEGRRKFWLRADLEVAFVQAQASRVAARLRAEKIAKANEAAKKRAERS